MFDRLQQTARTDLMAVEAIFASLAYRQNNTAEQAWLEKVIQEMYDVVQRTPLYQSWTRKALGEGGRQTLVSIVQACFPRLMSLATTQAAVSPVPCSVLPEPGSYFPPLSTWKRSLRLVFP